MHSAHFVAHHVVVMRVSTESLGSPDFSVLRGETGFAASLDSWRIIEDQAWV
jgi:hypothetical protein